MRAVQGRLQPKYWVSIVSLYRSRWTTLYFVLKHEEEKKGKSIAICKHFNYGNGNAIATFQLIRATKTRVVVNRLKSLRNNPEDIIGFRTEEALIKHIITEL